MEALSSRKCKILAVEPYSPESHISFLRGLKSHSRHRIDIIAGEPHHWKWRMRTSPLDFVSLLQENQDDYDVLFASDYFDLATFVGLASNKWRHVKKIMYFHENQITYPTQKKDERDYHFAFTHLFSILASDETWFNSEWHKRDFFCGLKKIIKMIPHVSGEGYYFQAEAKSKVMPLGFDFDVIDDEPSCLFMEDPIILWNHRFEYDKNPQDFLYVLRLLKSENIPFHLILLGQKGESKTKIQKVFEQEFAKEIVFSGWVKDKRKYYQLLKSSNIVVSSAIHEFFGASIVEAIYAGCHPLLPYRLSYPEILSVGDGSDFFYLDKQDFFEKLRSLLRFGGIKRDVLKDCVAKYSWQSLIEKYDDCFVG